MSTEASGQKTIIPVTPILLRYQRYRDTGDHRPRQKEAQHFLSHPGELAAEFAASVSHFSSYDQIGHEFVPTRAETDPRSAADGLVRALDAAGVVVPTDASDRLLATEQDPVADIPAADLAFEYVAREPLLQRTRSPAEWEDGRPNRGGTKVDALLVSAVGTRVPIIAELKVGDDKDPYYALIQGLACTAHLVTERQYTRLLKDGTLQGRAGFSDQTGSPRADVYLLSSGTHKSSYHEEGASAAEALARVLLGFEAISRSVRRIAAIDLSQSGNGLFAARVRFGWERKP